MNDRQINVYFNNSASRGRKPLADSNENSKWHFPNCTAIANNRITAAHWNRLWLQIEYINGSHCWASVLSRRRKHCCFSHLWMETKRKCVCLRFFRAFIIKHMIMLWSDSVSSNGCSRYVCWGGGEMIVQQNTHTHFTTAGHWAVYGYPTPHRSIRIVIFTSHLTHARPYLPQIKIE